MDRFSNYVTGSPESKAFYMLNNGTDLRDLTNVGRSRNLKKRLKIYNSNIILHKKHFSEFFILFPSEYIHFYK